MKETLSDKRKEYGTLDSRIKKGYFEEKDVKEFIKKLKEEWNLHCDFLEEVTGMQGFKKKWLWREKFKRKINELAGEDLK